MIWTMKSMRLFTILKANVTDQCFIAWFFTRISSYTLSFRISLKSTQQKRNEIDILRLTPAIFIVYAVHSKVACF